MTHDTTLEPPRFTHDCEHCKYLGRYGEYDLYFCSVSEVSTARYGNKYWMQCVGPEMSDLNIAAEARRRAIAAGLLPAEDTASETITIAEVAAKLGLELWGTPSDWHGKVKGRPFILWDTSVGEQPRGSGWALDGTEEGISYSAREVCELAGVPYDRYEGREPEPAAPSAETVNTELLAALGDVLSYFGVDEDGMAWEIEDTSPFYPKLKGAVETYERLTGKPAGLGIKFYGDDAIARAEAAQGKEGK